MRTRKYKGGMSSENLLRVKSGLRRTKEYNRAGKLELKYNPEYQTKRYRGEEYVPRVPRVGDTFRIGNEDYKVDINPETGDSDLFSWDDDLDAWVSTSSSPRSSPRSPKRILNSGLSSNTSQVGFFTSKSLGGYRPTKRNLKYLKNYKKGKSIGFTMRSSLKAKGLIPRSNGTYKVSKKYRG